ncbi:uncharacterized protein LOC126326047 [Schistocerca gregaria]|uniref:uncharacterized protein LOC126326047 n=1 Tax=Schistocerca gregaria TaxID=7010 RepID=UPI00211EF334|nr:uncharacterized protein LOC126326047 [Schistocerca gregaria]
MASSALRKLGAVFGEGLSALGESRGPAAKIDREWLKRPNSDAGLKETFQQRGSLSPQPPSTPRHSGDSSASRAPARLGPSARSPRLYSSVASENETRRGAEESGPKIEVVQSKRKVLIRVAYLGTRYFGSSKQPQQDVPTVEDSLEKALFASKLISPSNFGRLSKIGWSSSSRTDRGVHSLFSCFCAKLEYDWVRLDHGNGRYTYDIADQCLLLPNLVNSHLPSDIRVLAAAPVPSSFDAKRFCVRREYEYLLPYSVLRGSLYDTNLAKFDRMTSYIKGRHYMHNLSRLDTKKRKNNRQGAAVGDAAGARGDVDQSASRAEEGSASQDPNDDARRAQLPLEPGDDEPIRTSPCVSAKRDNRFYRDIFELCHSKIFVDNAPYIRFCIAGNSFLKHQIRCMIGLLVCASQGLFSEEAFCAAIDSPFTFVIPRAPPQGLVLMRATFHKVQWVEGDEQGKIFDMQKNFVYQHIHDQWKNVERQWPMDSLFRGTSPGIAGQEDSKRDCFLGEDDEAGATTEQNREDARGENPSNSEGSQSEISSLFCPIVPVYRKDPWREIRSLKPVQNVYEVIPEYDQWWSRYQQSKERAEARRAVRKELKATARKRGNADAKRESEGREPDLELKKKKN